MVKNLYVMRHAITAWNMSKVWTGHVDISISSIVKHTRIHMPDIDVIISSTAKRCTQTLGLLDFSEDTKVILDPMFIECGYGKLTGMSKSSDVFCRTLRNTPESSSSFVGESRLLGGLRAFRRFQELEKEEQLENKNVLILSHKNTLIGFWLLFFLDIYCGDVCQSLNPKNINDIPQAIADDIFDKHPVPSPFVNSKFYKIKDTTVLK